MVCRRMPVRHADRRLDCLGSLVDMGRDTWVRFGSPGVVRLGTGLHCQCSTQSTNTSMARVRVVADMDDTFVRVSAAHIDLGVIAPKQEHCVWIHGSTGASVPVWPLVSVIFPTATPRNLLPASAWLKTRLLSSLWQRSSYASVFLIGSRSLPCRVECGGLDCGWGSIGVSTRVVVVAEAAQAPLAVTPVGSKLRFLFRQRLDSDVPMRSVSTVLLCGPPGCGKTSLVRQLCADMHVFCAELSLASAARDGKTVMSEAHLCEQMERSVLLLSEGLVKSCSSDVLGVVKAQKFKSARVLYIIECRQLSSVRSDVRACMEHVEMLDPQQLSNSLRGSYGLGFQLPPSAAHAGTSSATVAETLSRRDKATLLAMRPVVAAVPYSRLADVGVVGLNKARRVLAKSVVEPLHNPMMWRRLGICPPVGVLLHGPVGTGKTLLARSVAKAANARLFQVQLSDVVRGGVGDSVEVLSQLFRTATRCAPAVIFFDEMHSFFGSKGASSRLGVQLIAELGFHMDELSRSVSSSAMSSVIVVGATSAPELLDDSLKRPGRFELLVPCVLPDIDARVLLLELFMSKMQVARDVDIQRLAVLINDCSGADIAQLCQRAGQAALVSRNSTGQLCVRMADFMAAVQTV